MPAVIYPISLQLLYFATKVGFNNLPEEVADWGKSFDEKGWSDAPGFVTALYRTDCEKLGCIEKAKYFPWAKKDMDCVTEDWGKCMDSPNTCSCPGGYFVSAFYRNSDDQLKHLEKAECCKPKAAAARHNDCVDADWGRSFDSRGWSSCPAGKAIVALKRSSCQEIYCLEGVKCCSPQR